MERYTNQSEEIASAERIGSIQKTVAVDNQDKFKPTIPKLDFSSITSKQEAGKSNIQKMNIKDENENDEKVQMSGTGANLLSKQML